MLLLRSYYVRTIQLRKGGVLRGAAPQQEREGGSPVPTLPYLPKVFFFPSI